MDSIWHPYLCSKLSGLKFQYNQQLLRFERYPEGDQQGLRAWSAADELMLDSVKDRDLTEKEILLYNDRFGFLATCLNEFQPTLITTNKSHEKAALQNLKLNKIQLPSIAFGLPLETVSKPVDLAFVKVPKSMDLFRLFCQQVSTALADDGEVVCGFMTRHFTAQMLSIAAEYFETVEQTKAWKKSRLMILKQPKRVSFRPIVHRVKLDEEQSFQQYAGVFSAQKIDLGTRFLLENLEVDSEMEQALDLASGNGVLAAAVRNLAPVTNLHLVDDSFLAVESSRLNLKSENTFFHYNDCLEDFPDNFFDYVVSNPPFHFGHENNIQVSLRLFLETYKCLKPGGKFQLVANRHLNYKTHLDRIFRDVAVVAENQKFIVYTCTK